MIVTSWKLENLSDLADMCLGKMLDQNKNKGSYFPYLANTNVRWGQIELDNLREMKFEPKEFDRYGLELGDIVMCEGGEPGRCAIWKGQTASMMIQKALHRIRVKEGVSSLFLYYVLLNKGIQGHYEAYFTGAAIKHLTGESLAKIKVLIPPLPTQQKIAKILSAYDDLIENNLKRIKLLEEMAQLTYEEWFVRLKFPGYEQAVIDPETGLPEGWCNSQLREHIKFIKGKKATSTSDVSFDRSAKIILLASLESGVYKHTSPKGQVTVERGDIVMLMDGARSSWTFYSEKGVVGSTLAKVEVKDIPVSLLYQFFSSHIDWLITNNTGAAIPHANKSFINKINFLLPDKQIIINWNKLVDPINESVWKLKDQNQYLKEARDIVLPRLMTGMIDVESLELSELVVNKTIFTESANNKQACINDL